MAVNSGLEHRIEHVEPKSGYRLLVTWTSGEKTMIDFSKDVGAGGIWSYLRDERKFAQATTALGGAILEWPEPAGIDGSPRIDIDADGLWWMGLHQKSEPARGILQSLFHRSR
jgi:hypothetical protein